MTTRYVSVVLLAAIIAVVAAVGISAVEPEKAEAATYITVNTCDGGTIQLNSDEKRIFDLQNRARTKRGKKALCVHPDLTAAARAHSQEMLDKDYSAHESFNGETVKERLERYSYTFDGYSYYWYAENIAWGSGDAYSNPDRIFKWWMHSSHHRSNILDKKFREVGIGVQTGTYKSYTNTKMYTVDFGTRR